uniref:acid phosphatase n=1 Tax=Chromera velia CCMP2878 TaxID=1169474 RepID=A0A0G4I267_9ALVE|eukprot:Cvel_10293.t1-p1 / transcript=Cvel_10293.t1 / gene=Cvel_10293 / organism=Chromera_velia_CCMP2878 / gene_product=Tartrate-resistant acid phosphatase type 5, putative / transcript_product=Tartrate-resistant acid phosphatase type 5, putative / location=Cvel_scaffold618:13748-15816(+) / protein_length=316 / sequence_SO=supercontig / SO=protein_coding / is_pseudo=false
MGKVAKEISASFVLALGDNFYSSGIPSDDHDKRFIKTWEDIYIQETPSLRVPWYMCAGNHDHKGNVSAQIEFSHDNEYWNFPDYNYAFSREWADPSTGRALQADFILLDTVLLSGTNGVFDENDPDYFSPPTGPADMSVALASLSWLEKKLSQSSADLILVSGHYPVWSVCSHGPTSFLVNHLVPLLEKYSAHYLSGHDHCQMHISNRNVEYFVSGTGDECCYDPTNLKKVPADSTKYFLAAGHNPTGAVSGFASFQVSSEGMRVFFHDQDGNKLYAAPIVPLRSVKKNEGVGSSSLAAGETEAEGERGEGVLLEM